MALRAARVQPWPEGAVKPPALQAHRGHWVAGFRENTPEAFHAARENGYTMAELDVQLSRDGQAVVFHDEDLRRLGSRERVRHLTSRELARRARAVPLAEVLADPKGVDLYNVEVKAPASTAGLIEGAVRDAIRQAGGEKRVMLSSFNPFSLMLLAGMLPEVPRALLASAQPESGNPWPLRKMWLAPFLKIHMFNLDDRMLTPELISYLRARRVPFAAWTVNDRRRARELLELGALSVITDRVRPSDLQA